MAYVLNPTQQQPPTPPQAQAPPEGYVPATYQQAPILWRNDRPSPPYVMTRWWHLVPAPVYVFVILVVFSLAMAVVYLMFRMHKEQIDCKHKLKELRRQADDAAKNARQAEMWRMRTVMPPPPAHQQLLGDDAHIPRYNPTMRPLHSQPPSSSASSVSSVEATACIGRSPTMMKSAAEQQQHYWQGHDYQSVE
jgi:hypothetical protein